MDPPSELQQWAENAERWVANAERIGSITSEASDALIERLAPRPGQRLLDVAAGAGDPSLRLARLVGSGGHVTATDGVREMLDALERHAREQGLAQLKVVHCAAEEVDVPPGSYDGACSRFGVMFFSDPVRSLQNMRRAVRPGGRLVVVAWGDDSMNPYFALSMQALDDLGVAPAEEAADSKGVYEFEEDGKLLSVARDAGWQDARAEQHRFVMCVGNTAPEQLFDVQSELTRKLRERAETLDEAGREQARKLIAERSRPYAQDGDIRFPATAMIVTGRG